jgi:hypothetical protein
MGRGLLRVRNDHSVGECQGLVEEIRAQQAV